jgi:hypothetical protein
VFLEAIQRHSYAASAERPGWFFWQIFIEAGKYYFRII